MVLYTAQGTSSLLRAIYKIPDGPTGYTVEWRRLNETSNCRMFVEIPANQLIKRVAKVLSARRQDRAIIRGAYEVDAHGPVSVTVLGFTQLDADELVAKASTVFYSVSVYDPNNVFTVHPRKVY